MNSYYSIEELQTIGFQSLGEEVRISRKCSIYSPEKMVIGNHVRIDDFCILSGHITFGNYIHIAASCLLFGGDDGIVLEDFTGVSSRSALYAESDDYTGGCFTNPTLPDEYRKIVHGGVSVKKHAIIGSGCTVLPGVVIGTGCAVGAMSLVNKTLDDWGVYVGVPCRRITDRNRDLLQLEREFLANNNDVK